jgi:hypothetical protein
MMTKTMGPVIAAATESDDLSMVCAPTREELASARELLNGR